MRAIPHIAASTAAATAAGIAVEPSAAAGLFLFGGFLDVDHVGLFVSSGLPATPAALFHSVFRNEKQLEKKYSVKRSVPPSWLFPALHSLELVLLLAASGVLLKFPFLLWGSAGIALHLSMDLGSYPQSPLFFSILWRYFNRKKLMEAWVTHRSNVQW